MGMNTGLAVLNAHRMVTCVTGLCYWFSRGTGRKIAADCSAASGGARGPRNFLPAVHGDDGSVDHTTADLAAFALLASDFAQRIGGDVAVRNVRGHGIHLVCR